MLETFYYNLFIMLLSTLSLKTLIKRPYLSLVVRKIYCPIIHKSKDLSRGGLNSIQLS